MTVTPDAWSALRHTALLRSAHEAGVSTMNMTVRVVLAVVAAAGTLAIGRAAYAREKNQPMPPRVTAGVGVVLLAMYLTVAVSV